jgi:hypothetical protein
MIVDKSVAHQIFANVVHKAQVRDAWVWPNAGEG